MARIRTVKPEFFQDEALASCTPHARLLAIALLQICDAKGIFRYVPMQIHAHAFPWEASVNSPALLRELEGVGYVKFYAVDGKQFGIVPGFLKHQRLTGKEAQSGGLYPLPSPENQGFALGEAAANDPDASLGSTQMPRKGKGKGKEEREESGEVSPSAKSKFSPDDMTTAEFFFDSIRKTQPDFKKPNLNQWAESVRLMRERDNRDLSEICRVWLWARKDGFWQKNILSADKLRQKYDQLKANMGSQDGKVKSIGHSSYADRRADLTDAVTDYERATKF